VEGWKGELSAASVDYSIVWTNIFENDRPPKIAGGKSEFWKKVGEIRYFGERVKCLFVLFGFLGFLNALFGTQSTADHMP
jgi:hypothetical protein